MAVAAQMHAISASPTDSGSACCASGTEMKIEYATAAAGAMCVIDWNSTCGSPIECSRRWSKPRAALVAPSIAILLSRLDACKARICQTRRTEWTAAGQLAPRLFAEPELEPLVRRVEPEPAVEPVCVEALLVSRQLDDRAAALARLIDRPCDERPADPAPAQVVAAPPRLDLRAGAAAPRDAGDVGQLQHRDDVTGRGVDDHEQLRRVGVDRSERGEFRRGLARVVARRADLVGNRQLHDRHDVGARRPAPDVRGAPGDALRARAQRADSVSAGSGSPVSSSVLRFATTAGQPPLISRSTSLPSSKPSWTTVSFTFAPSGSISNVTFERGSAAIAASSASSNPRLPPDSRVNGGEVYARRAGGGGVNVYASRRGGSDSSTTCSGSAMVTPCCSQVTVEPTCQSDPNATP